MTLVVDAGTHIEEEEEEEVDDQTLAVAGTNNVGHLMKQEGSTGTSQ